MLDLALCWLCDSGAGCCSDSGSGCCSDPGSLTLVLAVALTLVLAVALTLVLAVDVGRSSLGRLDGMNEWGLLLKRRAHNLL